MRLYNYNTPAELSQARTRQYCNIYELKRKCYGFFNCSGITTPPQGYWVEVTEDELVSLLDMRGVFFAMKAGGNNFLAFIRSGSAHHRSETFPWWLSFVKHLTTPRE